MKFELLSDNISIIINEILSNERLIKLINNADKSPLATNVGNPQKLILNKIFPTPFFEDVETVEGIQIRIFFDNGEMQNRAILGSEIVFQIITPNDWWLIRKENDREAVRPYEIMSEIVNQFEDKSISTVGILKFHRFRYGYVNDQVTAYELFANMSTI